MTTEETIYHLRKQVAYDAELRTQMRRDVASAQQDLCYMSRYTFGMFAALTAWTAYGAFEGAHTGANTRIHGRVLSVLGLGTLIMGAADAIVVNRKLSAVSSPHQRVSR